MSAVMFLSGSTMGDALGATGRAFRKVFDHLGHEFIEVNLSEPNWPDQFNRAIRETRIEFVFTFVGMGSDLATNRNDGSKTNIWEALQIPFISLNGDSPAYFFDRHVMPGRRFACAYGFPEHYELRKRLPKVRGLLGVVPHVLLHPTPKEEIDFSLKEKGKLLFLKNGNDPEQLLTTWREQLPSNLFLMLADLAGELAAQIRSDLGNDIDRMVVAYFRDKGLDVDQLTKLRLFFTAQLDDYLRRLKSTLIVQSLLDFPIEVHGYNWEHIDFSNKRAKLVPVADYTRSTDLIRGALGLIDMSPNTGLAPHDRPMRAYGTYTLCLTNEQVYFKNRFQRYDAFSFRFDRESIQAKIADALGDPRRHVELGIEIAEAFQSGHKPEIFGQFMLDTAQCLRLEEAPRFPNLQNYFAWPPSSIGQSTTS